MVTKAHARVRAVDFGESFGPLVDVLHGRHLRFAVGTDRTINVGITTDWNAANCLTKCKSLLLSVTYCNWRACLPMNHWPKTSSRHS